MTVCQIVSAQQLASTNRLEQLQKLTLEDLLITSVSKKPEKAFAAAAAVAVITDDEIRRSGARNLGEVLRLAPGVDVAQKDSSTWAISSRGANDTAANKFLVLIDGRSVYNVANSGVDWWTQGVPLEDIERIEVIRGPGGTLYGANAVNGVVNIITKDAQDTQGGYVTTGYGNEHAGFGEARYGSKIGQNGFIRTYLKIDNNDGFALGDQAAFDAWERYQAGARADWHLEDNHLTLQADYIYARREQVDVYPLYAPPYASYKDETAIDRLPSVLARWTHSFPDDTDLRLQAYWDEVNRTSPFYGELTDTFDVDFQHRIKIPLNQELIYGLGYRFNTTRSRNSNPNLLLLPAYRNLDILSAFLQDEINLVPDRLKLTVGTKFENNDYTDFEFEPSARLAWTPTDRQTIWTAVSRAVRAPSRAEPDVLVNLPGPFHTGQPAPFDLIYLQGVGNPNFKPEILHAFELGYRIRPAEQLHFDLATYYFQYHDMTSSTQLSPFYDPNPAPGHLVQPITADNNGSVDTYGLELAADWEPLEEWRLRGGYAYFDYRHQTDVSQNNAATAHHNVFAVSSVKLTPQINWDVWMRYKSAIEINALSAYAEMDVRLAWKPNERWELAIVGQNLLHDHRREYGSQQLSVTGQITEVQRGVYGQVTCRF